jgi:hypothetical protein
MISNTYFLCIPNAGQDHVQHVEKAELLLCLDLYGTYECTILLLHRLLPR